MSARLVALALVLVACDSSLAPTPVDGALSLATDPSRDPLARAIADTTSVFSDAGVAIRDSEWWVLQQGLDASELPLETQREVLDQLSLVAPFADLRLPAALRIDERFTTPYARRHERWTTSDERVAVYALTNDMRSAIWRLVAEANGVIVLVEARLVRLDDDTLVGAEVSLSWSDCGWCQDGTRVVLDAHGTIVAQTWPQELSASGYCC